MEPIYIFLFWSILFSVSAGATECEMGWALYKNKLCVKIFTTNWATFQDANDFCATQGSASSKSSMVTVKDSEMQEILTSLVYAIYDGVWLGATYDAETSQFKWIDGEPLSFTNWKEGYPKNNTDLSSCVEFSFSSFPEFKAKWVNVPCDKRNMILCQREAPWTFEDAVAEIKRVSEEFQATKDVLKATQENLEITKDRLRATDERLETVNSRVVPVGSTYVEYYNQPSPVELWPELRWEDVSKDYEGLFFRAAGGESENWGSIQSECSPRISSMEYTWRPNREGPYSWTANAPVSGWSEYVAGGEFSNANVENIYHEGLRIHTDFCNVRPRNQAIRIWRRVE